ELRPLAERAAVRLLADEREPSRLELPRDPLEAFRRAREVGAAQIARPRSRPVRRVRHADALPQELELLRRLVEPRGEPRRVQQPPEVVARVREVRMGRSRHTARIDPAENDPKTRCENVRDVARRYAASASSAGRASIRSSKPLRKSSPL